MKDNQVSESMCTYMLGNRIFTFISLSVCYIVFTSYSYSLYGKLEHKKSTNSIVYPEDTESARELFQSWKHENRKEYHLLGEEFGRFQIFQDNLKHVNKLNRIYKDQTIFAINKYADMSPEEFQKKILMPKRQPPIFKNDRYIKSTVEDPLPDSFDWVPKNMVTSVKDQGSGGTCWAFRKHADCGVFGGWPYLAYQYIMKAGGLSSWADYPYCSGDTSKKESDNCDPCPAPGYNTSLCGPPVPYCNMSQSCVAKLDKSKFVNGLTIGDWKAIDQNETVIAEQLMKIGPLSIALNAEGLQFYHKGVYEPHHCDPKNLDHAVLLVGFGKDKTLFGETLYWKVKNSWGTKWGEDGYFRIKRNVGICGVNTQVTTAVLTN